MSDKVFDKNIVDEMSNSFLDYAMSVIVSRALPDVKDGLKPVQRRIIYGMNDIGNFADKPYKKSARIVGDVIGKYHPHGDSSVYYAMVRMSQDFSYRCPLVDGHGNFGSLDGDGAAAMRYTEARMSKMTMEMIKDINKNTIDYRDNYDQTEREPVVLPAKFPNLLVNGASGIAVGMATNIPPHNLGEVIDGVVALMDNSEISIQELIGYIKGPDFPLGGEILGVNGIHKAYNTGNGRVKVRGKYELFEEKNGKYTIIFNEIPFQVNKASLVEKIAENVKLKRIEGITDLRDESDRDGIRIVIELSRNVSPEVVINKLFKYTQLESNFSINMLALVDNVPKVLNLKEILEYYLKHQVDVITRRTIYDLDRAEKRAHILEGLVIALDSIDQVINTIRNAENDPDAITKLMHNHDLSEIQAKSILDMRLKRLTGLERKKIDEELRELSLKIVDLKSILSDIGRVHEIIKQELLEIKAKYADSRRSVIIENYIDSSIDVEDLIEEEDVIVTVTANGYVKRLKADTYKAQNRGGKGLKGINVNNEDVVSNIIFTSTHSDLLFFTNSGKVFKCRSHQIPEFSRTAKGIPLQNLIDIDAGESITNIISLNEYSDDESLFFVTKLGRGKRTMLSEYSRIAKNGKIAIKLYEDDEVVSTIITKEKDEVIIASKFGKAILSEISDYRPLGRTSSGVRALKLEKDDLVIGAGIVKANDLVFSLTENGYGKATMVNNYRLQKRGGKGIKNFNISDKTGSIVSLQILNEDILDKVDLMMISTSGLVIRLNASSLKVAGRATMGVKMMNLNEDDKVATLELTSTEEHVSRETLEGVNQEDGNE